MKQARLRCSGWRFGVLLMILGGTSAAFPGTSAAAPEAADLALPPGAEPALVSFSKKPRPSRSRNDLPDDILALLPWQGIYLVTGGTVSPASRVVVTSSGDLRAGSSGKPGASTTALIDKKRRHLDLPTLTEIVALADRAWRESEGGRKKGKGKPSAGSTTPTPPAKIEADPFSAVDYGEFLIIADGAHVFVLDGQGPISRPGAAALIKRLQSEAAK
ncbi:MAG TPA: hypothetical protein VGF45_07660 [Polyangia bacterium]